MKYTPIESTLFSSNRQHFMARLKPGSVAFFNSNDEMPRNGDLSYVFRQNSDLFWLSGIDQEQSILVLFPDAPLPKYREILFLRKTNEHIAVWEGHKYTKEEARQASGIQSVYWLTDFDNILHSIINYADNIYINTNENDRYAHTVPYRDIRMLADL